MFKCLLLMYTITIVIGRRVLTTHNEYGSHMEQAAEKVFF